MWVYLVYSSNSASNCFAFWVWSSSRSSEFSRSFSSNLILPCRLDTSFSNYSIGAIKKQRFVQLLFWLRFSVCVLKCIAIVNQNFQRWRTSSHFWSFSFISSFWVSTCSSAASLSSRKAAIFFFIASIVSSSDASHTTSIRLVKKGWRLWRCQYLRYYRNNTGIHIRG